MWSIRAVAALLFLKTV